MGEVKSGEMVTVTLAFAYPNRIIASLIGLFNVFASDVSRLGLIYSV